ncbi:MAG: TonB-dependent receptor, partial [Cyclobacteriaceae bacterium]|nr:TonB-dependent receptor [Cyclobacteriaceae bacterium HetDA_MAG_MS6]
MSMFFVDFSKSVYISCIFFILSLLCYATSAQHRLVGGVVTDPESGEPLPGATVVVKGTTIGTVTDLEGRYSLEISSDQDVLIVSFVGYGNVEEPVGSRSVIDVELPIDIQALEEIVVVGYGTIRKSDLTGSVSSIKGEELVKVPSVNPMQALQGKVPGLQIVSNSGAPGEAPVVRIRGVGTTGNPDPIYVVDGMIVDNIDFLSATDIESVEVLKDASATAIYGNRGANGVILVTTKLGSAGQQPVVTVSAEFSIQNLQQRIDLLNGREFAEVVNEINPGSYNNLDRVPNTDWQDLLFQTAPIHSYQVSFSGGSEKNQYYYGIGYFDQEGIIPESRFQRLTVKLNNRYSPKDYLTLGTNVTIAPFKRDNTVNDAPFNVYRAQPVIEPFADDGSYNEVPGVGNILGALEFTTDRVTRGVRSVGNFFAEVKIIDGLIFKTSFGIDAKYEEEEDFTPVYFIASAQSNDESFLRKKNATSNTWIWENTLSYNKQLGVHRINAVVGYSTQNTSNEFTELTGRDLFRTGEDFRYLDPSNIDPSSVKNEVDANGNFAMISYLGRVNYSFDNRYLFTFTFRRDGSSKFLGENRYNNFPAVAFGWNVINENFMPSSGLLSNLKVRASWGIVGNDKIAYDRAYSRVDNNINAVFGLNEQQYFGQTDGALGNPDLIWEEVNQVDVGVEIGLFGDQLVAEIDYYNRETSEIFIPLEIPNYLGNGVADVTFNAGKVRNRGLEMALNYQGSKGALNYSVGLVATTIDNEMLKVSGTGGADDELLGIYRNRTVSRTTKGSPIGAFYGYVVDGVFQDSIQIANTLSFGNTRPGDLIFRDVNDDGVLNADDRTMIGSPIPDLLYGLQLSANYKGIGL